MNKRQRCAFTLIELLIAITLVAIGIGVVSGVYLAGRRQLRHAEDKIKAMNAASMLMDEQLARSFAELEAELPVGSNSVVLSGISCVAADWSSHDFATEGECLAASHPLYPDSPGGGVPFSWDVTLERRHEGNIPYMHVQADVSYNEDTASTSSERLVRLENMLPYPFIHFNANNVFDDNPGLDHAPVNPAIELVRIDLPVYEVDKNIEVIYNVALEVQEDAACNAGTSTACIRPMDTAFTECRLVDPDTGTETRLGGITRTPLISQPMINNHVVNDTESAALTDYLNHGKAYTVRVMGWVDDPRGQIGLKQANIVVIAMERPD